MNHVYPSYKVIVPFQNSTILFDCVDYVWYMCGATKYFTNSISLIYLDCLHSIIITLFLSKTRSLFLKKIISTHVHLYGFMQDMLVVMRVKNYKIFMLFSF